VSRECDSGDDVAMIAADIANCPLPNVNFREGSWVFDPRERSLEERARDAP
jgi:hypothetical protein